MIKVKMKTKIMIKIQTHDANAMLNKHNKQFKIKVMH